MRIEKSLLVQRILMVWFWVLTCTGFIADELFGSSMKLRGASLVLTDVTLMLLAMWTIREKWDYLLIIAFAVISWYSTCVANGLSLVTWANGSRVFFGLLFVLPILRYFWQNQTRRDRFVKAFDKTLLIFLYVQAICILWQYVRYSAGDRVGGSFGNGFSGMVSILIYLVSFYLLQKRIDNNNFLTSLFKNWQYILLLLPTFFNETKISFVLVVIYFLLLIKVNRMWFARMLVVIPLGVIFTSIGMSLYFDSVTNPTGETDISEYILGQDLEYEIGAAEHAELNNDGFYDIPRIAKIAFIGMVFEENPHNTLLGFGVGVYKGHQNLEEHPFSKTYGWLVGGTNPYLCHVIFQLGIVGLIFVIILKTSWFIRPLPGHRHRNHGLQLFLFMMVFVITLYNDIWRESVLCFIYLLLMCISWKSDVEEPATDAVS